jgi:hypothetical protein
MYAAHRSESAILIGMRFLYISNATLTEMILDVSYTVYF